MSDAQANGGWTAGRALGLWLALFSVFCFPFLRGEVVFPHDNARELGAASSEAAPESHGKPHSNRFFSDLSSVYVPELALHLNGERSSWIATWNPHVELGRPAGQLAGLGKAYWPTHLASFVFDDPVRALTWLTLLALFLGGLFAFGLARELGLAPLACWTAAVASSLGIYPLFWLTFAVHLWSVAWALGLLWGIARFVRRPGIASGVLVAFVVHSMLLSAYPQAIVWSVYLSVPFAIAGAWKASPGARCWRPLAGLALAAAVGALTTLPVWMDVMLESQRSARGDINASYFLPSIPRLRGLAAAFGPLGQLVDPFRFGNPVDSAYGATAYKGTSLAPAFAALILIALAAFRRSWGLWLMLGVALAMTLRPLVYLVGVERLGLGLSRFPPLAGAFVPMVLLVAYGVDRALSSELPRRKAWVALAGLPYAVALGAALVPWSKLGQSYTPPELDTKFVIIGLLATAGSLAFVATRRGWIWIAVVALSALVYGRQLALVRPRAEIRDTSSAVETLRLLTDDGSRFMKVGARVRILPPNQESWLGLSSVHTYNSLVSRAYRRWVTWLNPDGMDLGHDGEWEDYVEAGDYGRQFRRARQGPALSGPELSWTGTSVLLSKTPLDPETFEPIGGDLYRPSSAPVLQAQMELPSGNSAGVADGLTELEPDARALLDGRFQPVERVKDEGDVLRFRLQRSDKKTLLFISQQYHPSWVASSASEQLTTARVRSFYQGVIVPPGTTEIELRFLPSVRFAWLPQLLFVLAGAVVVVARRRSSPG